MTYQTAARAQQDKVTEAAIDALLERYLPSRPCLVFLPGGMASELQCSTNPYEPNTVDYDFADVWLSWKMCCGDVLALEMVGQETVNGKLVVAPSSVVIGDFDYYLVMRDWARRNRFNLLTVAYDWRQTNADCADLLDRALEMLDARLTDRFGDAEALAPRLHLLAHSLGGMILKLYLNRATRFVAGMRAAISVGSPFYGYGGQLPRYFNGMSLLNKTTSPAAMARMVASLPGPYMLPFLDPVSFDENAQGLAADPDAPLTSYPVTVTGTTIPIDAYGPTNPLPPGQSWYPPQGWVAMDRFALSREQNTELTAPLPPEIAVKFHNFRGIQTEDGAAIDNTVVAMTWGPVVADFDPDTSPSPIIDIMGRGDDTIPAWSARLLSTPVANIQTFSQPLEHAFLLDVPDILKAISQIVAPDETDATDLEATVRPPTSSAPHASAIAWLEHVGQLVEDARTTAIAAAAGHDGPLRWIIRDMLKR